MAASITTHVATKKPNGPGSVQRPMSIPLSWVDVTTQLTAAKISSGGDQARLARIDPGRRPDRSRR